MSEYHRIAAKIDEWLGFTIPGEESLQSLPPQLKEQFRVVYADWDDVGNAEGWLDIFLSASDWTLERIPLPTQGGDFENTEDARVWMDAAKEEWGYDFDWDHRRTPIIAIAHGEIRVIDGIHRLAMAWAAGDTDIMAWVGR